MDDQKQQLIDRIKQAQNILVTVSANPSVDQLAAAIGLTIALNKMDKHGTAVFSGQVPSTIDFLKPEDTLEKNTDSLRDFIIALDKSKADKLRYKVEDQVVRIFITPYKTSLSEKDLDFSQGDFNVDVVIALGVTEQQDLDTAVTAHGRILHDATLASVSTGPQGSLGTIHWVDASASSLSEMVVALTDGLDKKLLDGQIATALLTGIVATTERFSNEKTSPKTMSASAQLMAAGANQQLIATELEAPVDPTAQMSTAPAASDSAPAAVPPPPAPGTLEISHELPPVVESAPEPAPELPQPQVHVDEDGQFMNLGDAPLPQISQVRGVNADGVPTEAGNSEVRRERMTEPPKMNDGDLTANSSPEEFDLPTEELSLPAISSPLLSHNESVLPSGDAPQSQVPADPYIPPMQLFTPPPQVPDPAHPTIPIEPDTTLTEIEAAVDSPHLHSDARAQPAPGADGVDSARNAVEAALNSPGAPADPLQPIAALNAQPLGPELQNNAIYASPTGPAAYPNVGFSEPTPGNTPADDALDMPLPSNPFGPGQQVTPQFTPPPQAPPSSFPSAPQQGNGQTPPPPVPPPMLPPLH